MPKFVADSSVSPTGLKWAAPASGATFAGCVLTKSTGQSITENTATKVSFNTESIDTDGYHDNSTNNTRITIPTGKGGKYLIIATCTWAANATGLKSYGILKNGSTSLNQVNNVNSSGTIQLSQQNHFIADLVATDYIELDAYHQSGTPVSILGNDTAAAFSQFSVTLLGS